MTIRAALLVALIAVAAWPAPERTLHAGQVPGPPAARTFKKHVLAWADVRNGYQHESITHALATIERLGWESGLYDTIIRTDSQSITKHDITFKPGTGIATGEQFLARNLSYFDAIFFFGVREIDLDAEQRADLLAFVRDDGKGFVATHAGSTAFFSWPEFGDMLGGRFDEHPWNIVNANVIVETRIADDRAPADVVRRGGRALSAQGLLARQAPRAGAARPEKLDLKAPLVHRKDRDFPVA